MKTLFFFCVFLLFAACNNTSADAKSENVRPKANEAKSTSYSIIKAYPHDTSSFTEGLTFYNGELYESAGEYGRSNLLKVDLASGKILSSVSLDSIFFGEGVTVMRDTIYQLTWKEKKVFAYTLEDLRRVKSFNIDREGWGMTNNGKELIASDGGSNLYYYDPSTFQLLRTQAVTEDGTLSYNLNELEYIDGYIYANQWLTPYIFKIDAGSGVIVEKIDLTEMWTSIKTKSPLADVPNGIAYDAGSKKIFITGKKWPELYEIELKK